jgi:H/ACA ribonucleoprotein complex subunit 3
LRQLLRRCFQCNVYTLKAECPKCSAPTHNPHPAKFSPDDKYARYRVMDRYRHEG